MGLYSALILARMEEESGRSIRSAFDLISGTSVGGIIALAAASGVPMAQVARTFMRDGVRIFPNEAGPTGALGMARRAIRLMSAPKHDPSLLRGSLEKFIPDGMLMGDIRHRVCVAAVDLSHGLPHTFRTPYSSDHSNSAKTRVLDVALAASAAPMLFPLHRIGDAVFCDGALYANSPDLLALHEAEVICGVRVDDVHMLSVGTTSAGYEFDEPRLSFGLRDWLYDHRMVRLIMSTQQGHAHRIAAGRLGDRYVRVDEKRSAGDLAAIGLDRADRASRDALRRLAERTMTRDTTMARSQIFMEHQARPIETWCPDNGLRPTLI